MSSYFSEFYQSFTFTFISLFAIVNPIGLSSFFYSLTSNETVAQRHRIALRVARNSLIMLIVTYFIGSPILQFFGISLPALQVAGGIVVFASSWSLFNRPITPIDPITPAVDPQSTEKTDISFFPLTMPITVGAGSIAVIMAIAAEQTQKDMGQSISEILGTLVAIGALCCALALCYGYSDLIYRRLGKTGAEIVSRLTAFIMLAIAITITWSGISTLIKSLLI